MSPFVSVPGLVMNAEIALSRRVGEVGEIIRPTVGCGLRAGEEN